MSQALVILTRKDFEILTAESALALREEVLACANLIWAVTNKATHDTAIQAQQDIKALLDATEKSRVALKAPVLKLGRDIDATAAGFAEELQKAYARIDRLVCEWQSAERARQAEIEALRQKELDALKASLPAPATRQEFDSQQRMLEDAAASLGPTVPVHLAAGQNVKEEWHYVVEDIQRLYGAYGIRLVKLEERRREILELINGPDCPREMVDGVSTPKVPGLRIEKLLKNRVRVERTPKAIDV